MPAISNYFPFTAAGGFLAHGQRAGEQYAKVAGYAALILRGTDPGTLPVQQPAEFDLVINLRTAKALGLTVPTSLLVQATQVIE
jgi:putative ABC transport system substrate-binding protein